MKIKMLKDQLRFFFCQTIVSKVTLNLGHIGDVLRSRSATFQFENVKPTLKKIPLGGTFFPSNAGRVHVQQKESICHHLLIGAIACKVILVYVHWRYLLTKQRFSEPFQAIISKAKYLAWLCKGTVSGAVQCQHWVKPGHSCAIKFTLFLTTNMVYRRQWCHATERASVVKCVFDSTESPNKVLKGTRRQGWTLIIFGI